MLKWFLSMSRWQLRKFYPKLRNSRPVKTLIRLMIIKSSETSQVMAGRDLLGSVARVARSQSTGLPGQRQARRSSSADSFSITDSFSLVERPRRTRSGL